MKQQTEQTNIAQSDQPCFQNGCKVSALYHNSKELGLRKIHDPTRMEAVEFDVKTVEIESFHHKEAIKVLLGMVQTLRDHNKLQQKLIDENRVRIQELEKKVQSQ